MSSVDTTHPSYLDREEEWRICADALRGQQAIKDATRTYLPCPSGFDKNPDPAVGADLYQAYLLRAQFPDIFALTLRGMVGLIHRKEAVVEGLEGSPLEPLHESCTHPGKKPAKTLMSFHQEITEQLLAKGRAGVLTEFSSDGSSDLPWFALYTAESIINWSPYGNMYVLDESGLTQSEYDEFRWQEMRKYRVLRVVNGQYEGQVYSDEVLEVTPEGDAIPEPRRGRNPDGTTAVNTAVGPRPAELNMNPPGASTTPTGGSVVPHGVYVPRARGGKKFDFIPLVIGGPVRMGVDPASPPLLGIARAAVSMYQLNADYRHQLFMSGQETMYASGVDEDSVPKVIGAGIIVGLPVGGVLAYASPTCSGITAHSKAIAEEESRAISAGVQLFDQGGSQQSGDALRLRYGAQTATLITISRQSAAILEASLRNAARMAGMQQAQIERIIVKPNLDFLETIMSAQDANGLVQVWMSGAISYETLYENFIRGGIESGERTASEEQELIDEETPDTPVLGAGGDGTAPTAAVAPVSPDETEADPGDGTEAGPESITDDELYSIFGSYADDVVGGSDEEVSSIFGSQAA